MPIHSSVWPWRPLASARRRSSWIRAPLGGLAAKAVANTALKSHRRAQRKESRNVAIGDERPDRDDERPMVVALSDSSQVNPLERIIEREAAGELRARLAKLPHEQRAALMLSAAGYGTAEVAAALGLSVRATRKRIEYGNRALREQQ